MSMNTDRARSAFAESAGEINQQLGDYRNDVDNIKGQNKNLKNTFQTAKEMTAIRDVASEAGVRALKSFGGKYLKSAYEFKIPKLGSSVADLDKKAGQFIEDRVPGVQTAREGLENLQSKAGQVVEDAKGAVKDAVSDLKGNVTDYLTKRRNIRRFGRADPESETELTDLGSENNPYTGAGEGNQMGPRDPVNYETVQEDGSRMGQDQMEDPDNMMGEAEDTAVEGPGQTFEEFMDSFSREPVRTSTGDIDFDAEGENTQMSFEDADGQRMRTQGNQEASERDQMGTEDRNMAQEPQAEEQVETPWDGEETKEADTGLPEGEGDVTEGAENLDSNVRDAFQGDVNEDAKTTVQNKADAVKDGEDLGDAGEGGIEDAGADAIGETAGEEGAVGGLEGVGTALDATGVFAPLGALFNLAGLAVEGFTAYEAGKGVVDWVKDDVLGHGAKAPQVGIPHPQKTLSQQGMMVIPTTDSIDTQQTVMGW